MAATPIPIRNLYYLFLYAWERFPEGKAIDVSAGAGPDLVNLFAKVLVRCVERAVRRGLDRGYRRAIETTRSPRGEILVGETVQTASLSQKRVVCGFDEFVPDVLHNQIIKATLRALARAADLEAALAHEVASLWRKLDGISDINLVRSDFGRVQLVTGNRHYDLLLKVCRLLFETLLPGEGEQRTRFHDILQDEEKMSRVFEAFIRNFYRAEQKEFHVRAEQVAWDVEPGAPQSADYLPTMQTDVTLRAPGRTIVIDAKFYREIFRRRLGGHDKIRSEHLYQLLTYISHMTAHDQPVSSVEGILLYPQVSNEPVRLKYLISGHPIQVCTVALDREWRIIHDDLLALLG